MTPPLVVLYIIPIGLIAIVIIAIIRLIARAASGGSKQQNYTQYRQPPPPPGQHNPGANPYTQNPYQSTPPNPNQPVNPNPNSWQNTQPNQQTDYTQQTYNQPNYNQPNYNQPNYNQPNYTQPSYTGDTTRSTNIGSTQPQYNTTPYNTQQYSTHVGETQKKSKTTLIVVLSIIGVVVLLIGSIGYIAYQRSSGAGSLVSEYDFQLAYENPTDNTYYIVLDEWDTIKVEPYTTTDDLDYMHRRDRTEFHWQMFTEDMKLIADTTVSEDEMQSWVDDKNYDSWGYNKVLFNPSRTEYVYYTAWFDEIGLDYMDEFYVGDSTYFADAYVVNDAFIFDERDNEFETDLADASDESELQQNQYLVNAYDFATLYNKLNDHSSAQSKMDDYRDELVMLFENSKSEVMVSSDYDVDDLNICYSLDSMTPAEVDEYTQPRDFIPAIDFVKQHASLFKATARDEYNYVVDSAEALMNYVEVASEQPVYTYIPMRAITYLVTDEGILADELKREVSYEMDRSTEDATYY